MPQFFVSSRSMSDGKYIIDGEDYHHLVNVRRVRENDIIVLRDEKGRSIKTRIAEISETGIKVEPVAVEAAQGAAADLTLCAAVLKGKKFDLVIQKCVELGVGRIVPVVTERSIPRISDGSGAKPTRWRRIAAEAAKQCMAPVVPVIDDITDFNDLIGDGHEAHSMLADPEGRAGLREYLSGLKEKGETDIIRVLIGPEGGFSRGEIEVAESAGWVRVNFGNNRLRAETASIALSAIILYELGDEGEHNA